jgi:hypothetical protein
MRDSSIFSKPLVRQDFLSQHIRSSQCARYQKVYLLRGMLVIELGGPEKPMGWASVKSLSGPAHGLEPTAQQLRPLEGEDTYTSRPDVT